MKLVTIEYPKTSCKLSKTTRPAKKFSQVGGADKNSTNALYSETTKTDFFYETKTIRNAKITKDIHAC